MTRGTSAVAFLLACGCGEDPRVNGPYLEHVSRDTAVVAWETASSGGSQLEWDDGDGVTHVVDGGPSSLHRARLMGLDSSTRYRYRVVGEQGDVAQHAFTTAPAGANPIRFAVYGDSQDNGDVHRSIVEAIAEMEPAFVLHVGDAVQDGREQEQWHERYFTPGRTLLASTPVYAAMGNHEYNADWYYYYHAYEGRKSYYAFSYGPAHVITLDTNLSFAPGSEQYDWLLRALSSSEAQTAPWLFVSYHHPAYTNGWGDECDFDGEPTVREILVPLMHRYGVDMVFNGHMHGYERGVIGGVQYVVSGGGGGKLDQLCRAWPHISVAKYRHHFVTVDLSATSLALQARDAAGEVLDELMLSN